MKKKKKIYFLKINWNFDLNERRGIYFILAIFIVMYKFPMKSWFFYEVGRLITIFILSSLIVFSICLVENLIFAKRYIEE